MKDSSHPTEFRHPYQDPELDAEARIDDLLERLTLEEKLDCLGTDPGVPRLGIRGARHVEGLHGLTLGGPGKWGGDDPAPTTTFPQAIGLAATWDPELVRLVAALEARETRYYFHRAVEPRGGLVVRAPNADLGRDPRWGRSEECFGEDPTLTSRMAVGFVQGLQGDHPRYWQTAALLKHFLANSNEDARESTSSNFDERQLQEYYAAPFREAIVQGGSRAFMTAYNAVNGVPCTYHPVVRELAVDEWGQDGIVCTDAHAAKFLVSDHKTCRDLSEAVARSLKGGITQFLGEHREAAAEALASGLISEADVDQALRRTFRVMLRLGLWDPPELVPYTELGAAPPWQEPESHALCRRVTQKSVVLLKNSDQALPLSIAPHPDGRPRRIAVVGPLADRVHGDWYGGTPLYAVTPLAGILERAGDGVRVEAVTNNDLSAALMAARRADVCLVCIGNHPTGDAAWAEVTRKSYGKEAVDRQSLELEEEKLVEALFRVNPATILVLITSFPYAINWSQEHLPAIVQLTHASQELGRALADVLFGDVNPAGRLVQTWPRSLDELPPMLDYDITRGRTYMYAEHEPLYPFGHGLSYTSFGYRSLELGASSLSAGGGELELYVDIENLGPRDGEEVVQLYVSYPESRVSRPRRQLVDFHRVAIASGQTERVPLKLEARQLAYFEASTAGFCIEPGEVELLVGPSSGRAALTARVRIA